MRRIIICCYNDIHKWLKEKRLLDSKEKLHVNLHVNLHVQHMLA